MDLINNIIFVGTGGGGSMVGLQALSTGGMWWNVAGVDFYVDPGPACVWHLRNSLSFKLPVERLQAIFISHAHMDHVGDLNTLIEAHYWAKMVADGELAIGEGQIVKPDEMKTGTLTLFTPKDVIDPKHQGVLYRFHKGLLGKITLLEGESAYPLEPITLRTTQLLPEKPWYKDLLEYGFMVEYADISVGYVPETYYRGGLFSSFHPELLVLNAMLTPSERGAWESVIASANAIRPKRIILRHFSMYAYQYGREKLAKELVERTGIPTDVAYDFSVFDLKEERWIHRSL